MARFKKLKLFLLLFFLGLSGIISLLSSNILDTIIPDDVRSNYQHIPELGFKLILLTSPTVFLIISILMGLFTYEFANLKLPILEI